ncbi:TRAP transporter small permease subunit [Bordetella sp. 15P40C-2]|nr:TRAP transporter small permease subunit [Bordetella sp. 15P40C-2]MVW80893.1 TRAP transporter small permease subunit [Bordetella sp. 02P26C-1]
MRPFSSRHPGKPMRYINKFVEALITLLFVAIVIAGTLQVFNRFVFNVSLSWSEEFQKFAFVWVVFLAIPVAYNRMAHLRVDTFFERFPPAMQRLMVWIIDLLWIGLGVALMAFTWRLMQVTKYQMSPGLGISMSVVYAGMVVGGAYLVLSVLSNMVRRVKSTEVAA